MKNLILFLALSLSLLAISAAPQSQKAYEYKFEYKMNEKKANDLGAQGWELVTVGTSATGALINTQEYIFKRPK